MTRRILILGVFLTVTVLAAACLSAAPAEDDDSLMAIGGRARAAERQASKTMPILERPRRFGHVYGNTVRRRHRRQARSG